VIGAWGVSQWPLLAFHSGVRSIAPPFMSEGTLTSIARRSSNDNFSPSSLFSLLHLKRCTGLTKLQNIPQSFNCIEFNLFIFSISSLNIYLLCFFLSNLIVILLISIYFVFNPFLLDFIFWFIPNRLILIFCCWIWSSFLLLQFLLFWVFFLINYFFLQFHSLLFNFIKFSYHILCLFYYYYFKTRPESRPLLCPGLGWITRVTEISRIFLLYMK